MYLSIDKQFQIKSNQNQEDLPYWLLSPLSLSQTSILTIGVESLIESSCLTGRQQGGGGGQLSLGYTSLIAAHCGIVHE